MKTVKQTPVWPSLSAAWIRGRNTEMSLFFTFQQGGTTFQKLHSYWIGLVSLSSWISNPLLVLDSLFLCFNVVSAKVAFRRLPPLLVIETAAETAILSLHAARVDVCLFRSCKRNA